MNNLFSTIILLFSILFINQIETIFPPPGCTHPIYCNGSLLSIIQLSQVFNDSKTFVDMPMKYSSEIILGKFSTLLGNNTSSSSTSLPSNEDLLNFLSENFYEAGYEVQPITPIDWIPHPPFLKKIKSRELSIFAQDLHNKWLNLARVFNTSELCDDCHSSIPVANPFIIAGSRFREFYYWDSYWIIRGLLVSDMAETARGMLENMASLIKQFGFMPNGGRIYYLDRSQPPLFTQMVKIYFQHTEDVEFLTQVLPILQSEYEWWMRYRSVEVYGNVLNLYNATTTRPRPESYYEDYTMAQEYFTEDQEKTYFYSSIISCAESGMDFSTRWMKPNSMLLETVQTIDIIPVDLNSILYENEKTLSDFYQYVGNSTMSNFFKYLASQRANSIFNLHWDINSLQFLDFNMIENGNSNLNFYISNLLPLYTKIQESTGTNPLSQDLLNEIIKNIYPTLMSYVGGVPTSLINSSQQWDYPNAWAPLQYWVIEMLETLNTDLTHSMALDLIKRWVTTNYCGWYETLQTDGGIMFEKYNVNSIGLPGGGGEYVVEQGFGWSNGVILYLLDKYSDSINLSPCPNNNSNSN